MSIGDKNATISAMHTAINKLEVICRSTQPEFAITWLLCEHAFEKKAEIVQQQTQWHRMHCLG